MHDDEAIRPGPHRDRIDRWLIDVHQRVWDRLATGGT
jgi:hypothetical protein